MLGLTESDSEVVIRAALQEIEIPESSSVPLRLAYYGTTQFFEICLLAGVFVTTDLFQTIFDSDPSKDLGGFTLLTGFSEIYFFFILFRDSIFMTLLLFAHKTINLALEFRLEMCAIDSMIILVLAGCCSLLMPHKSDLSAETTAAG